MEQAQCAQVPQEPPPIEVDPDGDLLLKVGITMCLNPDPQSTEKEENTSETEDISDDASTEEQGVEAAEGTETTEQKHEHDLSVTFRVCSRTLARSSPVWKKMLYGGFAESRPKGDHWMVELPDDDAGAIEFFLYAIHARFDSVPAFDHTPELEDLDAVAVIADKYDLVRFLRPWARTWIASLAGRIKPGHDLRTLQRYLWISWVLGAEAEFHLISRYLVTEYQAKDRDPLHQLHPLFCDVLEPPEIRQLIKDMRLNLIKQLLAPLQEAVDQLIECTPGRRLKCAYKEAKCEEVMLGRLIRSMRRVKLWPLPLNTDILMSINSLIDIVNTVLSEGVGYIERQQVNKRSHLSAVFRRTEKESRGTWKGNRTLQSGWPSHEKGQIMIDIFKLDVNVYTLCENEEKT
ncbi:nuclear pore protein [Apiospora rasikravindrae]|uniref:Nuclear pore protein n=1 Tax=Apiospora rasikravindrae TaxID=990691 RepID=A0ABR1SD48_9PEZI